MRPSRPLLACYGGGHVQIIAPLVEELKARGSEPTVIGLTTAFRTLRQRGINARSIEALLEVSDAPFLELAEAHITGEAHPDITKKQTQAYFGLGIRDLVERLGEEEAIARVKKHGRKAFEPISIWQRYLKRIHPDMVVATTSPRYEAALLTAARNEGLPTLAVSDLFLVTESWIMGPDYAETIAVFAEDVADMVQSVGFRGEVRVTGNPAFDRLVPKSCDPWRRKQLRARMGLAEKTVVLCPAASAPISMIGRSLYGPDEIVNALEPICVADPSLAYIIRSHPNNPLHLPDTAAHGVLDDGSELSPEDAILIADVVCVQTSTMGLQSALVGKPVICVGYADYVVYPKYGLASSVNTLEQAADMIAQRSFSSPKHFRMPPLGSATGIVTDLIQEIASRNHCKKNSV